MGIDIPTATSPLILIVDANILLRHALNPKGQAFLGDARLFLLITEYTFAEYQRHVGRRVRERAQAEQLTPEQERALFFLVSIAAEDTTTRYPLADYATHEQEARRRIPDDPDDWHTAALALAYGAAIWTEDKHFWGCGIAVWGTDRLLSHLAAE